MKIFCEDHCAQRSLFGGHVLLPHEKLIVLREHSKLTNCPSLCISYFTWLYFIAFPYGELTCFRLCKNSSSLLQIKEQQQMIGTKTFSMFCQRSMNETKVIVLTG